MPDAAPQRLRRAQHPGDRRQARPADPQRDEHRRRARRLRPRDRPARRPVQHRRRARRTSRGAACRRASLDGARLARPVEHLQRPRRDQGREALGLGPDDVVRDRRDRRRRAVRQRARARRSRATSPAGSTRSLPPRSSASTCSARPRTTCCELTREERERIFNLGYFTWVEQQGVSLEDFEARRDPAFWARLREQLAAVGRADRRAQRPHRRAGDAVTPVTRFVCAGCGAGPSPASRPVPLPERGRATTSTTSSAASSTSGASRSRSATASRTRSSATATCSTPTTSAWATPRFCGLVERLDRAVAAVDGHGFTITPFARSDGLSDRLGFSATAASG